MRANFQIQQNIALVVDGNYYDLHNNFDFIGFEYRPTEKVARLEWRRGEGNWIPKNAPAKIILVFSDVTNLAVKRRDDKTPFSEDSCLENITFTPPDSEDQYDVIFPEYRSDDEHLSFGFMSGAGLKIWAKDVTAEIKIV
jgi:hypothetical protein